MFGGPGIVIFVITLAVVLIKAQDKFDGALRTADYPSIDAVQTREGQMECFVGICAVEL